ncbi:OpgC domain-containing protein [Williamsia phyllosphaerae]|uniref:OpgC protein n=1 Tax=Williamsia phyllosphaerae TaxID=885042 RepID=A0ABQ1V4E2_9NOCA|nr:OpgC domain-containing protein [Williamsia phyllosphaerae]GGF38489.1 hypothetical protein GCM10007298_37720 [Williamsia phyllosphaerae]
MTRDRAIDATRGLAIFSMVSGHFALGTDLAKPTHVFPYADGASAFVLLSGLLLGIVHRGWSDRTGSLRESWRRIICRAAVIYLCQVLLALTAVAVSLGGHTELTFLLPVADWSQGLWWALTLRYLPGGGNILVLYLVLIAITALVLPLLRRGAWPVVLAASLALYAVALVDSPAWFYISSTAEQPEIQNWAMWQIIFVPALVVGWLWHERQLGPLLVRAAIPVVLVAALGAAVSIALHTADTAATTDALLVDKLDFGPGRAVAAWTMVPAVYAVLHIMIGWWRRDWLRPLCQVGSRSLDSYVLQSVLLMVLPIIVIAPWSDGVATGIALGVFGLCWAWAEFRRHVGLDKLHRAPVLAVRMARRRSDVTR